MARLEKDLGNDAALNVISRTSTGCYVQAVRILFQRASAPRSYRSVAQTWLGRVLAFTIMATAITADASVFYRLDVVAASGTNNWTGFGLGPSVNNKGKVAFVTKSVQGDSVAVWNPLGGLSDIASGMRSSTRSFGDSAKINNNDEVVTWDRTTGVSPIGEVRVFRSATSNDSTVMVRSLPGFCTQCYDTLYQYPTINNSKILEDDSQTGNHDGKCDPGEICVSQVAYGAYRVNTAGRWLGTVVKNPQAGSDFGTFNEFALNTSVARPMMADNGSIVVRGNLPANPILLFNYNLGAPTQIAGSADGFTTLGAAPSIAPDGKVVAFAGNRGNGDGIFLSIEYTPGKRRLVRIAGENLNLQKAELGFDDFNNKLFFQSIELDSRVGIVYTPNNDGTDPQGSVIVSFIGTPNAASRINPGTGRPFTFTAQKGLFTMRIDLYEPAMTDERSGNRVCVARAPNSMTGLPTPVGGDTLFAPKHGEGSPFIAAGSSFCETGNDDRSEALFSRTSPIPVVQIGDTLYSGNSTYTISALSVNGPVAAADFDNAQVARAARIGDHRVAFWAQAGTDQLIVTGEHLDSDQDGLLDNWETSGIDLEGNGHNDVDLPGMGADPYKRDLFIQMDWVQNRANGWRHEPSPTVIKSAAQFFAAAPALPNGIQAGIQLHVDAGTGTDLFGQYFSRNMHLGALRGGNTVSTGGQTPDVMYYGIPGTVNVPGVTALDFDTAKAANFWSVSRGAREFAFLYIVLADFQALQPDNVAVNGVNPFAGSVVSATLNDVDVVQQPGMSTFNFNGSAILISSGKGQGQVSMLTGKATNSTTGNQILILNKPFTVVPDATSTYAILTTSGGIAGATYTADGAFGPGKNVIISMGGWGPTAINLGAMTSNFLGTPRQQWKTLVHEIGHLLTLKHGGTNHWNYKANYKSLMNYAYQLCEVGEAADAKDINYNTVPGFTCPIDDYSGSSLFVMNDWNNLNFKSSLNSGAVGQAFGGGSSFQPAIPQMQPETTLFDVITAFGPPDTQGPTITVSVPVANAGVALGSGIQVTFTAVDNAVVSRAEVNFDVNGDGVVDETTEVFQATATGGSGYTASIPGISGPTGTRTVMVIAFDPSGNPGAALVPVQVGAVAQISVPYVIGQIQTAATTAITGAGLKLGTVTTQSSSTVTAGNVISQNPLAGASVTAGSAVNLVVSSGPAPVTVPNLVGQKQAAATTAITGAGLKLGNVTTQSSSTVTAGNVISQNPLAGASVTAGSAVNLVVSSGSVAGDVNGDGVVTCADASIVRAAFGTRAGTPGFDARADVNKDGVIDVRDLAFVTQRLPAGTKCP